VLADGMLLDERYGESS